MNQIKLKKVTPAEMAELQETDPDQEFYLSDNPNVVLAEMTTDYVPYGKYGTLFLSMKPKEKYPFLIKRGDIHTKFSYCYISIEPEYEAYPSNECPPLKCGDIIMSKNEPIAEILITKICRKGEDPYIHLFGWKSNEDLFENYTYIDGSTIGRIKE